MLPRLNFGLLIVLLLALAACETKPVDPSPSPSPSEQAQSPTPSPSPEPTKSPSPTPSPSPTASPTLSPSPSPSPKPTPSPSEAPEYKVTKEVFDQTFNEVKALIEKLNTIIRNRDFTKWSDYLSPEYSAYFSDIDNLAEISKSKVLVSQNIVLTTLKEYFMNVVGPSRANIRLDDLKFLNENEVEAIMLVNGGTRLIVYRLKKIESEWKIGLSKGP